jgi:hypothetical protein
MLVEPRVSECGEPLVLVLSGSQGMSRPEYGTTVLSGSGEATCPCVSIRPFPESREREACRRKTRITSPSGLSDLSAGLLWVRCPVAA